MKKIIALLLAVLSLFTFAACGTQKKEATATKVIKIGASPVPHKEILDFIKPLLAKKGYDLKIVVYTDYVEPNLALNDGDLEANFFQHIPYMEKFNSEKGTKLVSACKVHIEPMGLYSKKIKAVSDIKNGAEIAIPNDGTNGSRALRVLENAGIIKLKTGELVTKLDITENPKNIKIKEVDAAQLPRVLEDVDAAVINTNYALSANLNPTKDAIAIESKDSPYANIIAVRKGDENKDFAKALKEVLNSAEVKKFIEDKYKGNIVPAF